MWPRYYPDRLMAWVQLREKCRSLDLHVCLDSINRWWQHTPWAAYYLHWDDRQFWPDPWQLLADNMFCDVARALGMLYTIRLLDRADCTDAQMIQTEQGNLVLVQQGKYIMNWTQDTIVNIQSQTITIKTVLEPSVLESLIR